MTPQKVPLPAIIWLAGLVLAWGGGWPMMKFAVSELPIYTFRAITGVGGGLCVLAFAALQGQPLKLPRADWKPVTIAAIFNVTGWFYFTALALTLLPAGRSVVLAYSMPLWAVIAARVMIGEAITARKLLGLILGMGAVLLLLGDDFVRIGQAPLGVLAILAAAASWAVGTIVQKRDWQMPVLTLAAWQLMIGSIPLVVLAVIFDSAPLARLTTYGTLSVVYVILIACLFGYWAWFNIVKLVPTAVASIAVLPVPLMGVASSAWFLGEPVGWPEAVALILITAALATALPLPKPRFRRR